MKIISIREKTISLEGSISNAVVSFDDHNVSLVAITTDQTRNGRPVTGFGFNSIGRYAQQGIITQRMMPRLLSADPESLLTEDGKGIDPEAFSLTAMKNEKPGGHGDRAGALGALELAVWDLNARLADEPACETIARAFNRPIQDHSTPVYAAGGYYYAENSGKRITEEFSQYQDMGFDAFKMKIGGASLNEDLQRIEAALAVSGSGSRLCVDANGRFDHETMLNYADAIAPLNLRWYEEAGDPLDYDLNAGLTDEYDGAVATGENLFSCQDVKNLIRFGGMRPAKDIFQMDAGLSYGLTEYAKMISLLEGSGFDRAQCFPHGGHLINLHIAIGLGLGGCEAYPGVFQPFGGYPVECNINDGLAWATDAPGFGLEQKNELRPHLLQLAEGY